MSEDTKNSRKKDLYISSIEPTNDCITNRAGLLLFASYLRSSKLIQIMGKLFGFMRKNKKGVPVVDMLIQLLCFFMDGTSPHLTSFDELIKDNSYAPLIGCNPEHLASSHAVKRFFGAFPSKDLLFRHLLQKIFLWRLKINQPAVIELGIDSMVLNNDDALQREGVEPTYKKVKGFHPVQMNWGRYFVDAVFRVGSDHSNHGHTVGEMICTIVAKIRKEYKADVPIIIRMDSGFYDQKLFKICEFLNVGYECGGRLYRNVKKAATESTSWFKFKSHDNKEIWEYTEFMCKQEKWDIPRRTIYSRLILRDRQFVIPGLINTDSSIITNIGIGGEIDNLLRQAGAEHLLLAHDILGNYHNRGNDELANRAIKDFGEEKLPFKNFYSNAAWYFLMLISNNMFESFKTDVSSSVIATTVYATTFRRKLIDTAAKIVRYGRKLIMKVPVACFHRLKFDLLFERSSNVAVMLC